MDKNKKWEDIYGNMKLLSSIFGPTMMMEQGTAQSPDVLKMGLGGAMTGLATAGPLGALLGLGTGILGGAKKKSEYEATQRQNYDDLFMNKRTDPSFYAKNGGILTPVDESGAVRVQAQEGEVAALPNGMIADVLAKKKHKEMKGDEVTDVLPVGTFIADTEGELKREDAEDFVIHTLPLTYSEKGEKNEFKEVKLSDLFGKKKKLKTAELLNNAKKHVPIPQRVEDEIHDPFAIATAQDNMVTRGKYIKSIMELGAKSDKKLRKQMEMITRLQEQQPDAN